MGGEDGKFGFQEGQFRQLQGRDGGEALGDGYGGGLDMRWGWVGQTGMEGGQGLAEARELSAGEPAE